MVRLWGDRMPYTVSRVADYVLQILGDVEVSSPLAGEH